MVLPALPPFKEKTSGLENEKRRSNTKSPIEMKELKPLELWETYSGVRRTGEMIAMRAIFIE
jgi:hypothetical protein